MILEVNHQRWTISVAAQSATEFKIDYIKNTKTGVSLQRFSKKFKALAASNDVRDVILDKLFYDICQDDFDKAAAEKVARDERSKAMASSITKFYNHPVWNAGGRTGDD